MENTDQPVYGRRPYDNLNGSLSISIAVLDTKLAHLIKCQELMSLRLDKLHDDIVALKLDNKDELHKINITTATANPRTDWITNPKVIIPVAIGFSVFVLALTGKINIVELLRIVS